MSAEAQVPVELARFKFSPDHINDLEEKRDVWRSANRAERQKIAGNVYNSLKKKNPQWTEEDRKLKKEGIFLWFHIYGRTRQSLEKFRDVKTWTARKVLAVEAEQDLRHTIQANTGGWMGSTSGKADNQKAFGTYQVELSKIWSKQSEADRERLESIAKLWNETGPPAAQQAKNAEKSYNHEYMGQLGGKSFFHSHPDWETKPVMGLLGQHAKEMHEGENINTFTYGSMTRKPYMELDTDHDGHPLLPDRSDWPTKSMEKKSMIRSYVAVAYRRATGKEQGIPPWTSIVQFPEMYFDPAQLPEGFTLLDPSKMKDPQIQDLLSYWYNRQQENGFGFQFCEDPNLNVRKRTHQESESESESESELTHRGGQQPPKKKQRPQKVIDKQPHTSKAPVSTKGKRTGKATAPATGKGTGKGQERVVQAGGSQRGTSWLDHIQPDSRRRKRATPGIESESGEDFDFREVDDMPDSDDNGQQPGPSMKPHKVRFGLPPTGGKTIIRQSTRGPKSKQKNLEMISVTSQGGEVSIQRVVQGPPSIGRTTRPSAVVPKPGDNNQPKSSQKRTDIKTCMVKVPSSAPKGPQLTKMATRATTLAMVKSVPTPVGETSVSALFQKARKGDKRKRK